MVKRKPLRKGKGEVKVMGFLRSEQTWNVYHGATPEIEVTVRSEEAFDELWRAITEMSRQRTKHGGSRVEYLIKLVE